MKSFFKKITKFKSSQNTNGERADLIRRLTENNEPLIFFGVPVEDTKEDCFRQCVKD